MRLIPYIIGLMAATWLIAFFVGEPVKSQIELAMVAVSSVMWLSVAAHLGRQWWTGRK